MNKENSELEEKKEEASFHPPKKKISSYLPVGLLKDLDVSEDSSCDEIDESVSPVNRRRSSNKQGQNLRRRRSSSHDFLNSIKIINLFALSQNQIPIHNFTKKLPTQLQFQQLPSQNENINNNINPIQELPTIKKPSSIKKAQNQIVNNNINKTVRYNLPLNGNNCNNQKKNVSFEPKIIQPRQKLSEKNLNSKKGNYNVYNHQNHIGNTIGYPPVTPKKHSSKSSQREFIDPDILNLNQTFKEFLDISGHKLSSIIRTSIGSRFLQKMLDKIKEDDITRIFHQLSDEIIDLMCDNYGNYFMQKIIWKCNLNQRLFLYEKMKNKIIMIANDIAGTHCLQALIGSMETVKEEQIIKESLVNHLLELSCNINSTHVIQKIVSEIREPKRDYVNNFIISYFLVLCKDVNGICLIKKFISENNDDNIKKGIIQCLENNCIEITQDQFGNYAIQHALDKYGYINCYNIIRIICNNIVYFANQKFSSNVVDKIVILLHYNNINEFGQLIQIMFLNNMNIFELIRNKFGMFVLMNSVKLLNNEQKFIIKNSLFDKLNSCENIEDQTILTRLLKILQ